MAARYASRIRQAGAVAPSVAVALVALLAMAGLAIDSGRMYVTRAELQTAADACALAAAVELNGALDSLSRAEEAGIAAARRNAANFQSGAVVVTPAQLRFARRLSSGKKETADNTNYLTRAAGAPTDARFVLCEARLAALPMTLSSVISVTARPVSAQAVATLAPGQNGCHIPVSMCAKNMSDPVAFGLERGRWYGARFDSPRDPRISDGAQGDWHWVDYTPNAQGPEEVYDSLRGEGECGIRVGALVRSSGSGAGNLRNAWNARQGIYENGTVNLQYGRPDFTGYAYTPTSWPTRRDALGDFLNVRRPAYQRFQGAGSGIALPNPLSAISSADHRSFGTPTRRLATASIVNCTSRFVNLRNPEPEPIIGFGCVLLLHAVGDPRVDAWIEFVAPGTGPDSACVSWGLPGRLGGANVPTLVQ